MNVFEELAKGRYGSFELKKLVGPNLIRGFIIAVIIHGVVAASPVIIELFRGEEEIPEYVHVIDPTVLDKIKLRRKSESGAEQVTIARPKIAPPKAAIPIAVKEEEITEEPELMPSQQEIAEFIDAQAADEGLDIPAGAEIVIKDVGGADDIPDMGVFIPFEVPPQPLPDFSPQPEFPELARTAGVAGKVIVQVYVDKSGDVKKWKVVKADPKGLGFEEEVEKVIKKWKFTPAIQQGNPVGVWVAVPFNFKYKK